jgi:hypothetical protein
MMSTAASEVFDRLRGVEDESLRNQLKLVGHERECAIRYEHINTSVSGIREDLRKAATAGMAILMTVLGFLIKLVFFSS